MRDRKNQQRVARGLRAALVPLAAALLAAAPAAAQTVNATFKVVCLADRNGKEIIKEKACLHSNPSLSFGGDVTLAVEHAPEVTFDDSTEPSPANLVLFLNGRALPGTRASVGPSETDEDDVTTTLLTYHISRDLSGTEGRKNWKEVLVAANSGRLAVSTGLEDGPAASTRVTAEFIVVRPDRLVWWFLTAVAGLVVFFVVAKRTGALRDTEPAADQQIKPPDRAYSLARVQMALWTMLVFYAYLYIWWLTGEYNATIPASIVGLMGITLTTFGAAQGLDKSKDSRVCVNQGFVDDISTSAEGAALHRLQFELWTVGLAAVFVVTVWRTLAMPDFDATQLGLMGLTSGAYVGLKTQEEKGLPRDKELPAKKA